MLIGKRWGWKIAVGALILTVALAGKVLSQDKPVTAPAAPAAATAPAPPPSKPDPAGTATGGVGDVAAKEAGKPRIGKFNKDGTANPIPRHNIPMGILGCFILAFGWFGFNPGSTLAGTDLRIVVVAVNTMLASASGGLAAMAYMWIRFGKPDPSMSANGFLAGLVAITAPCAFVSSFWAFVIGLIAGFLLCWAVFYVEKSLKADDPVGAIAVHGVNGAWGVISLGFFADGTYGDPRWARTVTPRCKGRARWCAISRA